MSAHAATPATALEGARMVAALAWVVLATALSLAAVDALPGWLVGESRAARRVPSVEAAERALGARLATPAYYPSRLGWPPAEVMIAGGRGGGAALTFRARTGGGGDVHLLQATAPGAPIPPALAAVDQELSAARATVGDRPATLARVLVGGQAWDELRWERDGRAMALRTQGGHEELLRMARTAHRQGGP